MWTPITIALEILNLINNLTKHGVEIVFVRQPELSTAGAHGKLLLQLLCRNGASLYFDASQAGFGSSQS
jgi:hypothetical protein